jgi:tetratricopeptide (TPR) repeat protein
VEVIMVRALFTLSFLCSSLFVFSQQPQSIAMDGGNVITTPEQVHRALPPDPSMSPDQLEKMGDQLRGEKNLPDAHDHYFLAIQKEPSARLYNKLGLVKVGMMRLKDAKKDFQKATKLDKNFAEAENNLGAMLYYLKDYGGAIKHYKKAIKLTPSANFYSNLGTAYFARKDYDRAEENYRTALNIDPEVFERQKTRTATQIMAMTQDERAKYDYVLAKIYAVIGDSERCVLYLRKAMEEGYPVAKDIQKDKEFAGLRDDPRVRALLEIKPITED